MLSIADRFSIFGTAVGRAAKAAVSPGQDVLATPSYVIKRRAICEGCPDRDGKQCGKCSCFIVVKTRLATEHCPVGRW